MPTLTFPNSDIPSPMGELPEAPEYQNEHQPALSSTPLFAAELAAQFEHLDDRYFYDSSSVFENNERLISYIEQKSGVSRLDEHGYYQKEFCREVQNFLNEYINYCLDKLDTTDEKQYRATVQMINRLDSEWFGMSPNLVNDLANFENMALLAARAMSASPEIAKTLGQRALGEVNYHVAFDITTEQLHNLFAGKTDIEKLQLINLIENIGITAVNNSGWAEEGIDKVESVLVQLATNEKPLVALAANAAAHKLREYYDLMEWDKNPELINYERQYAQHLVKQGETYQKDFHNMGAIAENKFPVRIANDAVALVDNAQMLPLIISITNNQVSPESPPHHIKAKDLDESPEFNPYGTNKNSSTKELLQEMHRPLNRILIESLLHINFDQITLRSQVNLVNFMVKADEQQFQRLQTVIEKIEAKKEEFLESFLALEMGDEFGDILLEVAEKLPAEHLEYILANISTVREEAQKIATKLTSDAEDEAYARGINLAIAKRVTEVLSIIPPLTQGQDVAAESDHLGDLGPRFTMNHIEYPAAALAVLALSLKKINEQLGSKPVSAPVNKADQDLQQVQYKDVTVSARPVASENGESRFAFKVRFTPEELLQIGIINQHDQIKAEDRSLSLRLDLEEATDQLSFDMGTTEVKKDGRLRTVDLLVGVVTTAGAQELARRRGQDIRLADNHVREAFSPELAQPNQFSRFAIKAFERASQESALATTS